MVDTLLNLPLNVVEWDSESLPASLDLLLLNSQLPFVEFVFKTVKASLRSLASNVHQRDYVSRSLNGLLSLLKFVLSAIQEMRECDVSQCIPQKSNMEDLCADGLDISSYIESATAPACFCSSLIKTINCVYYHCLNSQDMYKKEFELHSPTLSNLFAFNWKLQKQVMKTCGQVSLCDLGIADLISTAVLTHTTEIKITIATWQVISNRLPLQSASLISSHLVMLILKMKTSPHEDSSLFTQFVLHLLQTCTGEHSIVNEKVIEAMCTSLDAIYLLAFQIVSDDFVAKVIAIICSILSKSPFVNNSNTSEFGRFIHFANSLSFELHFNEAKLELFFNGLRRHCLRISACPNKFLFDYPEVISFADWLIEHTACFLSKCKDPNKVLSICLRHFHSDSTICHLVSFVQIVVICERNDEICTVLVQRIFDEISKNESCNLSIHRYKMLLGHLLNVIPVNDLDILENIPSNHDFECCIKHLPGDRKSAIAQRLQRSQSFSAESILLALNPSQVQFSYKEFEDFDVLFHSSISKKSSFLESLSESPFSLKKFRTTLYCLTLSLSPELLAVLVQSLLTINVPFKYRMVLLFALRKLHSNKALNLLPLIWPSKVGSFSKRLFLQLTKNTPISLTNEEILNFLHSSDEIDISTKLVDEFLENTINLRSKSLNGQERLSLIENLQTQLCKIRDVFSEQ